MEKIIAKYNDLLANKYDEATGGQFCWIAPAKLEQHIKPYIKENMEVLDLGCGTGQTSKIFIDHGAEVTGVDISPKMLEIAGSKFNYKQLILHDIGKGLADTFSNKKFDIIVAVGILEFIENIEAVLSDVKRLLKDGGVMVLTYEIYDPGNKYGIKKSAYLGDGLAQMPDLLKFMVYRRTSGEMENIVNRASFKVTGREKFTAYFKTKEKIPVVYEIMLLKQRNS